MARIGIFGGTFDPVHHGHLIVAEVMMEELGLDRVLFLPAGQPPHKLDRPITPAFHRLTMLQLALQGNPHFGISFVDVERPGPCYTVDSLAILRREYPGDELVFLMGEDSLRDLPTWREPNRIAEQALLGVALRPNVEVDLATVFAAVPAARDRVLLVHVPLIQIAASDIRRRVAEGRTIRYQVPRAVEQYIERHGLYRTVTTPVGRQRATEVRGV
ncbi:nicotinate-nucleotide adenylyltransferase [Thermomicrobium sp. 4228-Ro]|uniref:nicotinate-nucleotide adenylyltransferase n=1 Tax=Thermomicrobium sp. 4228-Ro TaxID=2993937 RepID=UPI002248850C|nr:nicotinate-nucleotide adenylyltransferase [Thermomicrobium sp. 4228-Ro]MCX2726233.1 nicotinate-nucleotide adenylyltransferase [Thermomicrobium sp. 4228-Ro]